MMTVPLDKQRTELVVKELETSQQLIAWTLRCWFAGYHESQSALEVIEKAFSLSGLDEAVYEVDEFCSLVAVGARYNLAIGCPNCPKLFNFERDLITVLSHLQQDSWDSATHILERHLGPDEAFMAGPPCFRWAREMSAAHWVINPIADTGTPVEMTNNIIPFPFGGQQSSVH
ncbi:MAG: hypothetical protein KI792_13565 [Alphaproteobacteria bacterium]|nr:hypothetical protein [Alphaproteobacteria bacterium SS10]